MITSQRRLTSILYCVAWITALGGAVAVVMILPIVIIELQGVLLR